MVNLLGLAKKVFEIEILAANKVKDRLDERFVDACQLILANTGRIIVTGVGKSGLIARKIAATFTSTGTPAFFIHLGEALHGDIGAVTSKDIVIAISYSGNANELDFILPVLNSLDVPLIGITSNFDSRLAKASTVILDVGVNKEADKYNLAPTASSTATLIMGDALAVAVSEKKGFTSVDFARSHPGGVLGWRLTKTVGDLMKKGEKIPLVDSKATILDAIIEMSKKGLGMVVIQENGQLVGVYTDGDIRRSVEQGKLLQNPITTVMTKKGKTIHSKVLAVEAVKIMKMAKITSLVVSDQNERVDGVIHLHDLLQLEVI